jgi:hypothetical protein
MPRVRGSGELTLALALLVGALGVDFLWYRPQQREFDRLLEVRWSVEDRLRDAHRGRAQSEEIIQYVASLGGLGSSWKRRYRHQDPLLLLESLRSEAGLRRDDLVLRDRQELGAFTKTSYVMSVNGGFEKIARFLRELERAGPLVTVDALTMVARPEDPGLTLRLDVSVVTLAEEGR